MKQFTAYFIEFQLTHLIEINGVNGVKKGTKIIKSLVSHIISAPLLKQYTWTGRTVKGAKKFALETKKQIIHLIFAVVKAYDAAYSLSECEYDLTYKVCKIAHLYGK